MTDEQIATNLLNKAGSLGKAQARYMMAALVASAFAISASDYDALRGILWLAPPTIGFSIMAWFGIARASGEVGTKLKELVPGYNYGHFGGAPPFVWAVAYSPHGKRGMQRFFALMSYPIALTLCMSAAIGVSLATTSIWASMYLLIPVWQVVKLWLNRLKAV